MTADDDLGRDAPDRDPAAGDAPLGDLTAADLDAPRDRRTKVCCTLGPASSDPDVVCALVEAGMDIARLNFSHGDHDTHHQLVRRVRDEAADAGRTVALLGDLSGPKIRVGDFAEGSVNLRNGQTFTLTTDDVEGTADRVQVNHPPLPAEVEAGQRLLLADGALELEVEETTETDVVCRVVVGGTLASRKGVAAPGAELSLEALTRKDEEDLAFCLDEGFDLLALSYVQTDKDVRALKERLDPPVPVYAKIEMAVALRSLSAIVEVSDGVLVARGDLGVQLPLERIPLVQKSIIAEANRQAKPVITATQMLKSMVEAPRPTRAEVTDVATAILDGTDAVMLSEETAVGQHPVESVRVMDRVAREVEGALDRTLFEARARATGRTTPGAVSQAAVQMAREVQAKAIVTPTSTGLTARLVARFRPEVPILAPSRNEETVVRLAPVWGVQGFFRQDEGGLEGAVETSEAVVKEAGIAEAGDVIVITAGYPFHGIPTNLVHVHTVR